MSSSWNRRQWVGLAGASLAALTTGSPDTASAAESKSWSVGYCLNFSTIRGQKLPLDREIAVAAEAGYDGIEPWIGNINKYVESGGKLADIRKQIEDSGLTVASAIGFANWIIDDDAKRAEGLEQAKRDMDLVRQLGGRFIAAPPVGVTKTVGFDLRKAAERYHALLELGAATEVTPQLELWGFSKTLHSLGELAFVAAEAGHPNACVLPDVYHIYKGGSDFHGLKMLNARKMHCFHMNDYPADPPREQIGDADCVYPGDGVAPLKQILNDLRDNGFEGMLSLELFNRSYWKEDPVAVAKTGLAKMKQAVAASR